MAMEFLLEEWNDMPGDTPTVEFPPDVVKLGLTKERLLKFPAFRKWQETLKQSMKRQELSTHTFNKHPYRLERIVVQSFDPRGPEGILFVKLNATIKNKKRDKNGKFQQLPGIVFLRGGSVAVLLILKPRDSPDERYVIMTEQARIPAGSLCFKEIPAGMIDDDEYFAGVAAKEIEEEVGLRLKARELIDMTKLVMMDQEAKENPERMADAMYPSPGGCDEFISIFLWERVVDRLEIEGVKDKLKGDRAEMEHIKVTLEPYDELLQVGARDGKTLAAWSLYEYLKRVNPEALERRTWGVPS